MKSILHKSVLAAVVLVNLGLARSVFSCQSSPPTTPKNDFPLTIASPDYLQPNPEIVVQAGITGQAAPDTRGRSSGNPAGPPNGLARNASQTPTAGIFMLAATPLERQLLGITSDSTAFVMDFIPGSPAETSGLRVHDVIEAINGQPVRNQNEVSSAVTSGSVGDVIGLSVRRNGQLIPVRLTLGTRPNDLAVTMYRRATNGVPFAQYQVASNYLNGNGTARDPEKARYWLERAAANGIGRAWFGLAAMYEKGNGVPQNLPLAREYFDLMAAEGDAESQYRLAKMIVNGLGGPVDSRRGKSLFELAANQGHAEACFSLGESFASGSLGFKDDAQSFQWFLRAAESGHAMAAAYVGNKYAAGTGTARNPDAAVKWLTAAAKANVARAQHDLGALYSDGIGVPQDFGLAALWLSAAAEQGYVASMSALGRLYRNSKPPDLAKAAKWIEKAAAGGDLDACNALGMMLWNGEGIAKDHHRAAELIRRAASGGHASGQYNMGLMYTEGIGVPQSNRDALTWLMSAIAQPTLQAELRSNSLFLLGTIFDGLGNVPGDTEKAFSYYRQAAEARSLQGQRVYGQRLRDRQQYTAAIQWLTEAATRGDRAAQNDLGTCYYNGQGVAQSREQAIAWWLKAYYQGSTTARDSLRKIGVDAK